MNLFNRGVTVLLTLANSLAPLTYEQPVQEKDFDIRLEDLSTNSRQEYLRFAIGLLSEDRSEISPHKIPRFLHTKRKQRAAGEQQVPTLRDLASGMVSQEMREINHMEMFKWTYLAGLSDEDFIRTEEQETREKIDECQTQFEARFFREVLAQPKVSLDETVRRTREGFSCPDVELLGPHDYSPFFRFEQENVESYDFSELFPYFYFHTEEAIAAAETYKNEELLDRKLDPRTGMMTQLFEGRNRILKFQDMIQTGARTYGVDQGELAFLMNSVIQYKNDSRMVAGQQQQERRQLPMAVTMRLLALGALGQLRELYENDIDQVVIADRGANPFGVILEELISQLKLPEITTSYFKFVGAEKGSEKGALMNAFAVTEGEAAVLEDHYALRQEIKAARESEEEERIAYARMVLQPELEKGITSHRALYDRLAPQLEGAQLERAREKIGPLDNKKVAVYDDWINTGATTKNIAAILQGLGAAFSPEEVRPLIDSEGNASGKCVIRDTLAFGDEHATNREWRLHLPWKQVRELSGIAYGIDRGTENPAELFERYEETAAYHIPKPRGGKYTLAERASIAHTLLENTLPVEQTISEEQVTFLANVDAILSAYDSHESVTAELNRLRSGTFKAALQRTVRELCDELNQQFGKEHVKEFLIGKKSGSLVEAYARNQVEAAIQLSNEELRTIRYAA
jgi:hypothetical protein